jgi:hypothetical protein
MHVRLQVLADVTYEAEQDRLHSTISMAGIKLGPLFVPLPFKGRKGWLDMVSVTPLCLICALPRRECTSSAITLTQQEAIKHVLSY